MAKLDLKMYARRGAEARLAELKQELADIYRAFPDLRTRTTGARTTRGRNAGAAQTDMGRLTNAAFSSGSMAGGERTRKPMTAAQRKAVGERMKKYWAARKAAAKRR